MTFEFSTMWFDIITQKLKLNGKIRDSAFSKGSNKFSTSNLKEMINRFIRKITILSEIIELNRD